MIQLWMKLLGVKIDDAKHLTGSNLSFHGVPLGWILFMAVCLAAVVVWMYRRVADHVPASRKYILAGLRALFLFLILVLLLRPVLSFTVEQSVRKSLVILIDGTKSMLIKDPRTDENDFKRVAIAKGNLDATKGLDQNLDAALKPSLDKTARLDILKALLKNDKAKLLPRLAKEYDISVYTFDRGLNEVTVPQLKKNSDNEVSKEDLEAYGKAPWVDKLTAEGVVTAIGDSVFETIMKKRGQSVAAFVLMTDGASNSGSDALQSAFQARRDAFPIYPVGIGISSPRDIIVSGMFAPDVAFTKDELPVQVRVKSQNLNGETAKLKLELVDAEGGKHVVDEKDIIFAGDAEQIVTLKFTPDKKGEFQLKASIEPRADEVLKDNNTTEQHLKVVEDKIKVLLVDQVPRWEFKYMSAMLARDRRVDFKCYLIEGDPNLARGTNSPYLASFPEKQEDLYKFDLIIVGDVDFKNFSGTSVNLISKWVSEFGGSLVFQAGRKFNPSSYRKTDFEKMLPVELPEVVGNELITSQVADKPVKPKLTPAGKASTMMRVSDKEQESNEIWAKLPPVYWVARVNRAKPGAEVLMVDPDDTKKYRGKEEMPIMALQQYGVGQVLWVGTDNTWRWRKNAGDKYYTTFWGQIIYRMALPHLLGGSKTTQLSANQQKYTAGDRITIYARLYDRNFQPWTAANGHEKVTGVYRKLPAPGEPPVSDREIILKPIPDQKGMYRGEMQTPGPGKYEFFVKDGDREKEAKLPFEVIEPQNEYGDTTAMNETLLREMATASGGSFFREEDVYKLPDALGKGLDHQESTFEVEIWSSWLYLFILMAVLTAEWVMRKFCQLK